MFAKARNSWSPRGAWLSPPATKITKMMAQYWDGRVPQGQGAKVGEPPGLDREAHNQSVVRCGRPHGVSFSRKQPPVVLLGNVVRDAGKFVTLGRLPKTVRRSRPMVTCMPGTVRSAKTENRRG